MKVIIISSVFLLLCVACEREFQADLKDADSQLVIEASVCDRSVPSKVLISRTGSYFVNARVKHIPGAKVTLTVKDYTYEYKALTDSTYELAKFKILYDTPYRLTVQLDGATYEAESVIPSPVRLNYVRMLYDASNLSGIGAYKMRFGFTDPAETRNYYRVRYYINGTFHRDDNDYFLMDDEMFSGNVLDVSLSDDSFNEKDTIDVELMSIDKKLHRYYSALEEIIGDNASLNAAPSNPPGNFTNGALGYFSAYSSDVQGLVLKRP